VTFIAEAAARRSTNGPGSITSLIGNPWRHPERNVAVSDYEVLWEAGRLLRQPWVKTMRYLCWRTSLTVTSVKIASWPYG